MSTNDYSAMARQFLDMWQQQMRHAMTDQDFMQSMMSAMQQGGATYDNQANQRRDTHASTVSDEQLDDLTRRIRTLERRVSELESERADAAKPPAKRKKKTIAKRAVKPEPKAAKRPQGTAGGAKKPATKRATKRKPASRKS